MPNFNKIIRNDLKDFNAYRSTANREELGTIWLNSNELPFNINNNFMDIKLNRYPKPWPKQLLTYLSDYYQIPPEQILISRGSDEAIDLLIRLCCQAGEDAILISPPTFFIYEVYAHLQNAKVISVPLEISKQFSYPTEAVKSKIDNSIKIIFICSPNNPTGNLISLRIIEEICEIFNENALVVVDEAYIEFSQTEGCISLLSQYKNLVILRTLSKAFGLAGARCGVTIANEELIEWLKKISAPYPLATPVIDMLQKQLSSQAQNEVLHQALQVIEEREKLFDALHHSPLIKKVWPSRANFLLVETHDAKIFIKQCLQRGIIVRDYSQDIYLKNCVRITIGTPEENKELISAIAN